MPRWHRIRAGRTTREIVSWSIGIVVVLLAALLVSRLAQHVPWP
jgi:hypothetical protein